MCVYAGVCEVRTYNRDSAWHASKLMLSVDVVSDLQCMQYTSVYVRPTHTGNLI